MAEYDEFRVFTDYPIFDGDQHLSELADCYTRHIPSQYAERTIRLETAPDGSLVGMAQDRRIMQDTDLAKSNRPGSLKDLLKNLKNGSGEKGTYFLMDTDPAWKNRDLRLAQLERQGIESCLMFPNSLGLIADHYLEDDDLYYASSWSYLRWLEEEWGFSNGGRMYVVPTFSLRDPERTAEQLDWFFERGGKVVGMVSGPAFGRSPGDPFFDPVWSRINDAGAVVAYHINETGPGYKDGRSAPWGQQLRPTFFTQSAWQWYWAYGDVPAQETFSALIYDNLFGRFPNIKVVSAEHGCEWAPLFARKLDKMRGMGRNGPWIGGQLPERPSEVFKRHFRLVPFWEDDITPVVEALGPDVLIGGSDFPHAEGLAFPSQLVEHISSFGPDVQKAIMRDNALALFR
jgi:predicted TIM-barrel fold metal-dependent hydrolase